MDRLPTDLGLKLLIEDHEADGHKATVAALRELQQLRQEREVERRVIEAALAVVDAAEERNHAYTTDEQIAIEAAHGKATEAMEAACEALRAARKGGE